MPRPFLTDAQQAQLLTAAYAVNDPESFTRLVRERLEALPEIGDGIVYRTCRSLQPRYFTPPPDLVENGNHRPQLFRKKI
jgi:hypothetical protein